MYQQPNKKKVHYYEMFFHNAGVVRVYYDVKMGSPSTLDNMDAILATADFDFRSVVQGDIILYEGVRLFVTLTD